MSPFRLWDLIQKGALYVAERFFGTPRPHGTLYGSMSERVGPYPPLTQEEATEIGGIASQGVAAGGVLTATGNTPAASVPDIPAHPDDVGFLYRVAVDIEIPTIFPGLPATKERILVPVITPTEQNLSEVLRLAENATEQFIRDRSRYERLIVLLNNPAHTITPKQVVAIYNQFGIQIR